MVQSNDITDFWVFNRKVAEAIGYHAHRYDHVNDHGAYASTFDGYLPYILHDGKCRAVECGDGLATCTTRSNWHATEEDAWDEGCPAFSENMMDAVKVVNYFTQSGGHECLHHFEMIYYASEDQWCVEIGARECNKPAVPFRLPQDDWGDLPEAICRAALAVLTPPAPRDDAAGGA